MLAPVHFRVAAERLLDVSAPALNHIRGVEPSLQVPTTQLPLVVLFVAGPLQRLLQLRFMILKIWQFTHEMTDQFFLATQ
jgi:hypothetical protein